MKNVLVTLPVNEAQRARLDAAADGCRIAYIPSGAVSEADVAEADAIVGNVPAGFIHASQRLELLQLNSAGADGYTAPGVLAESTVLCNATGAYSRSVAEHAAALTLMLMKKLYLYRDDQREGVWADHGAVTSPVGASILVVGLGDIGLQYARIMSGMGAGVIGVRRRPGPCPKGIDGVILTNAVDEALPYADVVFSILPGTAATAGFYTEERFRLMKKSALFINCGRGNAVDSGVLLRALQAGEIAAAAIDVTDPEPLPPDHPLWRQKNLLITPHVAGGFHLDHTLECIVEIACENLGRWLRGEECRNIVDFETGYRR